MFWPSHTLLIIMILRLVTFGRDDQDRLVICFPIFIKDFNKEPMTLHQIETVKGTYCRHKSESR